jgi:hypothetical protein
MASWECGISREYLSSPSAFKDYRFLFHAPLVKLAARQRRGWRSAIPWREIEDSLAAIYKVLTGLDKRVFTVLRHGR